MKEKEPRRHEHRSCEHSPIEKLDSPLRDEPRSRMLRTTESNSMSPTGTAPLAVDCTRLGNTL